MNKLVKDSYESTPEFNITKLYDVIHPKSLLAKFLFDNNPNKTVSLIKYYSSYTYMQRNLKAFSKVWTYWSLIKFLSLALFILFNRNHLFTSFK